jgi:hypothetical protein
LRSATKVSARIGSPHSYSNVAYECRNEKLPQQLCDPGVALDLVFEQKDPDR